MVHRLELPQTDEMTTLLERVKDANVARR